MIIVHPIEYCPSRSLNAYLLGICVCICYVAVPSLWKDGFIVGAHADVTAGVLLQGAYLFSQTNSFLLFLLRSLEDQELSSPVSFIWLECNKSPRVTDGLITPQIRSALCVSNQQWLWSCRSFSVMLFWQYVVYYNLTRVICFLRGNLPLFYFFSFYFIILRTSSVH